MKLKMGAMVGLACVVLYLLMVGAYYGALAISYYGDLGPPPMWVHMQIFCPCCSTVILAGGLGAFLFAMMSKADKLDP